MPVPNIFGTATSAIPLSQLDTNFATPVTIGNTAVQLGNTVTSFGNVTLTNVTISSGNVTVSAGSNTAPSITTVGDTNTGIFFPAADTIAFTEGGVESMRIDTSGNVGIGTSSPSSFNASGLPLVVGSGSGNTGMTIYSGTAASGSVNFADGTTTTDSYRGIVAYSHTSNYMTLWTDATERMRIDSIGNVGIGVTPSAWTSSYKVFQAGNASIYGASGGGYFSVGSNFYTDSGGTPRYISTVYARQLSADSEGFKFNLAASGTAGNAISWTQAMTLDASGNLLVGKTAQSPTTAGIEFVPPAVSGSGITITSAESTNNYSGFQMYSTGAAAYRFYVTFDGKINATNTTIAGISDQRLKENIRDLDDGLNTVMALKPRKFDWKEGKGADTKNARGFIAQEFETVFPDLIDEWKDPAPEGEDPYKSVRADLIPVLVKAMQEMKAIIDAQASTITQLQADVAALKGTA